MTTLILLLCTFYVSPAMGCLPTPHVLGGTDAIIQNFPYAVSIKRKSTKRHWCGGAIINSKFIITAGHCVCFLPYKLNELYIFVGSTKLSGAGQNHTIDYGVCHEKFQLDQMVHDIGLIAIKEKFHFSKSVKPIKILKTEVPIGTKLIVTGWGRSFYPSKTNSDSLQQIQIPIISLEKCKQSFESTKVRIKDSQFCTYEKLHKGTCVGDSGGPLTFNGLLVGLVSFGEPCALGRPDVNTKVNRYINWIQNAISTYWKSKNCAKRKLYPKVVHRAKKSYTAG